MFLGFQGWNPNLSDWRFLNGSRLSLNETIVEITIWVRKYFLFNFMVFPKFTIFKFVFRKIILGFKILIVKYMFYSFEITEY
jgi:hypothetical protein